MKWMDKEDIMPGLILSGMLALFWFVPDYGMVSLFILLPCILARNAQTIFAYDMTILILMVIILSIIISGQIPSTNLTNDAIFMLGVFPGYVAIRVFPLRVKK